MKIALLTSLIGNVVLLVSAGIVVSVQSHEIKRSSNEAIKWKQAAVKSYRLRAEGFAADGESFNIIAKALPSTCQAAILVTITMNQLRRFSEAYHEVATQVTTKLNEGELKEPLADAIWGGK